MRILLSNDDGIDAPGMAALVRALSKKHTVFVAAPHRQRSSISRSVSIGLPLHAEKRTLSGFPDVWAYAVDGTPVDCVRLALGNLLPEKVDLCVTGINYGYNIGTDTLYSGTAAAAIEAAVDGVPAIAMSLGLENDGAWMDTAGEIALRMVDFYERHPLPRGAFYNVNVPDVPLSAIKGAKPAALSPIEYDLRYAESVDETGNPCYRKVYKTNWTKAPETDPHTDRSAVYDGYVAVSVLVYNNENNALFGAVDPSEWATLGASLCV